MKKEIAIIGLIVCSFCYAGAQSMNLASCELLDKATHTSVFKDHFIICNYPGTPLTIVDASKFFESCVLSRVCEREMKISSEHLSGASIEKGSDKTTKHNIVLYKVEEKNNAVVLYFWQPIDNANLVLELKKCKRKIKVRTLTMGVF